MPDRTEANPTELNSFPTRRSSDLASSSSSTRKSPIPARSNAQAAERPATPPPTITTEARSQEPGAPATGSRTRWRSEEHTSELQSQSNLVCRLLLEKKN